MHRERRSAAAYAETAGRAETRDPCRRAAVLLLSEGFVPVRLPVRACLFAGSLSCTFSRLLSACLPALSCAFPGFCLRVCRLSCAPFPGSPFLYIFPALFPHISRFLSAHSRLLPVFRFLSAHFPAFVRAAGLTFPQTDAMLLYIKTRTFAPRRYERGNCRHVPHVGKADQKRQSAA